MTDTSPQVNFEQLIGAYVTIRDWIAE